jgi:predicted metal-dependent enzyme (double-stranded beta helix superfamily)
MDRVYRSVDDSCVPNGDAGRGFIFNIFSRSTSVTDTIHENAHDNGEHDNEKNWSVLLEVQGATDFVQQDVALAPGGFSGWHSHLGPVLITVKSGTATCLQR